jgi:hypothetical protein
MQNIDKEEEKKVLKNQNEQKLPQPTLPATIQISLNCLF